MNHAANRLDEAFAYDVFLSHSAKDKTAVT